MMKHPVKGSGLSSSRMCWCTEELVFQFLSAGVISLSSHWRSKFYHLLAFQICSSLLLPLPWSGKDFSLMLVLYLAFRGNSVLFNKFPFMCLNNGLLERAVFHIIIMRERVSLFWHILAASGCNTAAMVFVKCVLGYDILFLLGLSCTMLLVILSSYKN